jgi:hypothetical protein
MWPFSHFPTIRPTPSSTTRDAIGQERLWRGWGYPLSIPHRLDARDTTGLPLTHDRSMTPIGESYDWCRRSPWMLAMTTLDPATRLDRLKKEQTNLLWQRPIHLRLDQLVLSLTDAGYKGSSRSEVTGALILAAPTDAEELFRLVRAYRLATVRDAAIEEVVVDMNERRRSGPVTHRRL